MKKMKPIDIAMSLRRMATDLVSTDFEIADLKEFRLQAKKAMQEMMDVLEDQGELCDAAKEKWGEWIRILNR